MNVLLVHLNPPGLTFQLGLAQIASVLEAGKHNVSFIFLSHLNKREILDEISKSKPKVILISVASNSFELCKCLVSFLREEIKIPILLGGIHPTISPEECIELEGIRGICVGEGEYPVYEFVEAIKEGGDCGGIESLWIKNNGNIYRNEV